MTKNIVILSDGTGQEGGRGHNTNIYNIFNLIEDRTSRQVVFYDPGPGTGWQKITGNAFGRGFTPNLREAYRFIFDHYEVGDRIYMMGFSRGSATVRSLASFVDTFGILPHSRPRLIENAFKLYKKRYKRRNREKYRAKVHEFLYGNGHMPIDVHFVGVYDTVAALGFPLPGVAAAIDKVPGFAHKFHEFDLRDSTKHAYQALAVDDVRRTFHPILWGPARNPDQTVEEVWFAGMHTDVGGGYSSGKGLQNIPLVWLLDRAVACGIHVKEATEPIAESAGDVMHDSVAKPTARVYRRKSRSWPPERTDPPKVHASVVARSALDAVPVERKAGRAAAERYAPWILDRDHEVVPWNPAMAATWYPDGSNAAPR